MPASFGYLLTCWCCGCNEKLERKAWQATALMLCGLFGTWKKIIWMSFESIEFPVYSSKGSLLLSLFFWKRGLFIVCGVF